MVKRFIFFLVSLSASALFAAASQISSSNESLIVQLDRNPEAVNALLNAQLGHPDFREKIVYQRSFLNELKAHPETIYSVLQKASSCNLQYVLSVVLNLQDLNIDHKFKNGYTALHYAAMKNYAEIVRQLINKGAQVNVFSDDLISPLYVAVQQQYEDLVRQFLQAGARVDVTTREGFSPLFTAAGFGNATLVGMLLDKEANCNIRRVNGTTPLYIAAQEGKTDIVRMLLAAGADPNIASLDNHSPLYMATDENYIEIVRLLLAAGALPNIAPDGGYTPLHMACQGRYHIEFIEIVQMLMEAGADYQSSSVGKARNFPLAIALIKGHKNVAKIFIEKDAPFTGLASTGATVLHALAASHVNDPAPLLELFEPLKERLSSLHTADMYGEYPIHMACGRKNVELIEFLMSCGADIHVLNRYKETPLYSAVRRGNLPAIKLFCLLGADRSAKNILGLTPCDIAEINGHKESAHFLKTYSLPTKTHASSSTSSGDPEIIEQEIELISSEERSIVCSSNSEVVPLVRKSKKKSRGQIVPTEKLFHSVGFIKQDDEIFTVRQDDRPIVLIVHKQRKAALPFKAFNMDGIREINKEKSPDNFHLFSPEIDRLLSCGICVDRAKRAQYRDILDAYNIRDFQKYAVVLPGKIEGKYYDVAYAKFDKDLQTRGHSGAFVYLFDKKGKCYHRCFHETNESRSVQRFDQEGEV